jgi:hypothetical protein
MMSVATTNAVVTGHTNTMRCALPLWHAIKITAGEAQPFPTGRTHSGHQVGTAAIIEKIACIKFKCAGSARSFLTS